MQKRWNNTRKRQNRIMGNHTRQKGDREEGGKGTGKSKMNGKGCEKGEREPGRGHQNSVRTPPVSRGDQETLGRALVSTETWQAQYPSSVM